MLNSAQNRVNALKRTAEAQFQAARSSLLTHMQIPSVKVDDLHVRVGDHQILGVLV